MPRPMSMIMSSLLIGVIVLALSTCFPKSLMDAFQIDKRTSARLVPSALLHPLCGGNFPSIARDRPRRQGNGMHHRGRSSATNNTDKVATMMMQAAMVVGGCCRTMLLRLGRAPC